MLVGPAFLAGLGLLLQRVQAAPQAVSVEPELISILEEIHANTPITWHEVVNSDGSKSNVTDIDNAVWDDAVGQLAPSLAAVEKRQSKACHGSGSWAKQSVLKDGINDACKYLKDTPFGQTRVYLRPGYNSAGDPMTVVSNNPSSFFPFTPLSGGSKHYTKQRNVNAVDPYGGVCIEAEVWLIDNCHGNNQDSRGGWVTWSSGDRYGVDPQTHNCNC